MKKYQLEISFDKERECLSCPCRAETNDGCKMQTEPYHKNKEVFVPIYFSSMEEQIKNCPLKEMGAEKNKSTQKANVVINKADMLTTKQALDLLHNKNHKHDTFNNVDNMNIHIFMCVDGTVGIGEIGDGRVTDFNRNSYINDMWVIRPIKPSN